MPRTKVARTAPNNKRARENNNELEEILRDFEIETENSYDMLKSELDKALREVEANFINIKRQIPANILAMKMKDVRLLTSLENDVFIQEKMANLNVTVKETVQKADEGDLTSGSELGARKKSSHLVIETIQKIQTIRRSKSAINLRSTPGPRAMMSSVKGRTPLAKQHQIATVVSSHSKYKTPCKGVLQTKATSVENLNTITPKVNPYNPFSMMRHARAGEAVFSMTGSPILSSNVTELTANINIPVPNGVLSIRPQMMDPSNLDTSLINKIDPSTINHLLTLKANLDLLTKRFGRMFRN